MQQLGVLDTFKGRHVRSTNKLLSSYGVRGFPRAGLYAKTKSEMLSGAGILFRLSGFTPSMATFHIGYIVWVRHPNLYINQYRSREIVHENEHPHRTQETTINKDCEQDMHRR